MILGGSVHLFPGQDQGRSVLDTMSVREEMTLQYVTGRDDPAGCQPSRASSVRSCGPVHREGLLEKTAHASRYDVPSARTWRNSSSPEMEQVHSSPGQRLK